MRAEGQANIERIEAALHWCASRLIGIVRCAVSTN